MKRIIVWLGIICVFAAGGAGLWYVTHPKPEIQERLVVLETAREIAYLPHYVAAAKGYFRDARLDVVLGTAPKGILSVEDAERADIILTPFDRIIGSKAVAFAGLTATEPGLLVTREKTSPFAWTDISGKTVVGEHPEGTGQVAMEQILRSHEMISQWQYISIQHLPTHLRLGTYLSGTGEFIIITDPEASRLEKAGQGYIASDLTAAGQMPSRVAATTSSKVSRNHEALIRYSAALARAQVWIAQHSEEEVAVAASAFFPWVDYHTMVEMTGRAKETKLWAPNPVIAPTSFDHLQDLMIQAGELPQKIPFTKAVASDLADQALRQIAEQDAEQKKE
ncbi:MAG: ABC transporter substrate-binding protein [Eubacteriales bacterium]|jgi:NitT/TauT family transport system substrate-binding protein|nr:ABC transporter substrate-binding protein [Bacillota bacterium]MBV1727020.1 ABC transporter substrate-binding protein [Desulforudis sp.]MDQ7789233.1 ABC transporter substrate-binding protein [Clostridia bacterium]MDZ4043785.1 ABC transporter substrate-binding protein [Eubacteriales bacterium]MBU4534064.1 ABC transporter substrate-binding protein [Bacillota bacterium]